MGLDQYCYAVRDTGDLPDIGYVHPRILDDLPDEACLHFLRENPKFPMMYWRKHPDLHGWMERLYKERGGEGDFNCVTVRLHQQDLERLEDALLSRSLPKTTGFFFGASDPESLREDIDFVHRAYRVVEQGWAVYYDSWW